MSFEANILITGLVRALLDSDRMLIATVAQHGGGLIEEIKRRKDVRIHTLTPQNRETMLEAILTETQLLETKHQTPNTKP